MLMPSKPWNGSSWGGWEKGNFEKESKEQQSPFVQRSGFTEHLFLLWQTSSIIRLNCRRVPRSAHISAALDTFFMCVGRHLRNKLHPELVRFVNCRSLQMQCLLSAQWVRVCREKLQGLCVRWQVHSHLLLLGMLRKIYCLRFLLAACVENQYNIVLFQRADLLY